MSSPVFALRACSESPCQPSNGLLKRSCSLRQGAHQVTLWVKALHTPWRSAGGVAPSCLAAKKTRTHTLRHAQLHGFQMNAVFASPMEAVFGGGESPEGSGAWSLAGGHRWVTHRSRQSWRLARLGGGAVPWPLQAVYPDAVLNKKEFFPCPEFLVLCRWLWQ